MPQLALPHAFREADGGTLYLAVLDQMPGSSQDALLAMLERGRYLSHGTEKDADVRIVAGVCRDLQELVLAGRFRDDLLYRVGALRLRVPPLRERLEDIPLLAEHFLRRHHRVDRPGRELSDAARRTLMSYHWPGNVRELQECLERLSNMSSSREDPFDAEEVVSVLPQE